MQSISPSSVQTHDSSSVERVKEIKVALAETSHQMHSSVFLHVLQHTRIAEKFIEL